MKIKLSEDAGRRVAALMQEQSRIDIIAKSDRDRVRATMTSIIEGVALQGGITGKFAFDPATMEISNEPEAKENKAGA